MEIHFSSLPLEELKRLHQKADMQLTSALLQPDAPWEDIKQKNRMVTDLAILIHKRRAENSTGKQYVGLGSQKT